MKNTQSTNSDIKLTIMIPVRNEEAFIEGTLERLAEQTLPLEHYEILVVDGRSTDNTRKVVQNFATQYPQLNLKLLDNPKQLSSCARNIAVNHARGEYVLLIDGHVYIDTKHLLKNYIDAAVKNNAMVLGRPQPLSPPGINLFQQDLSLVRSSKLAHSGESFIYSDYEGWTSPISIGVMYHQDVFEKVGLFDERFDAAEDLEFNYRLEKAGYKCFTSSKQQVFYYPRENLSALFRQLKRYGYGRALFVMKHPERLTIETLIPPMFVLFLAVLAPAYLISSWIGTAFLLVYAFYLTILGIEGIRFSFKTGRNLFFKTVVIIHAVHVALGIGFLKGILTRLKLN